MRDIAKVFLKPDFDMQERRKNNASLNKKAGAHRCKPA